MVPILPILAGVALAQLSPGPNMLAVAATTFGSGRRAGLTVATGVASGTLIWASLFAAGAAALLAAFPILLTAMKIVGGGYLVVLAVRSFLSAVRRNSVRLPGGQRRSLAQAYLLGVGVVLTNPKSAMMWAAIALVLTAGRAGPGEYLILGVCVAISALIVYGGYAVLFSTSIAMRGYTRFARWIEAAFGVVFGGLGGALIIDGARDLVR